MSGYSIMVGRERAEEVYIGNFDKDRKPVGDQIKAFVQVGRHLITNPTETWARRVINGQPKKDAQGNEITIDHTDPQYKGELQFLKWGDQKGMLIVSRYLAKSNSLDLEYQDNIQKIKVDKEKGEDGSAQLVFYSGENKFDTNTQALLVQHIKVHSQNRDSISKNPDPKIKGYGFYEITEDNAKTGSIDTKEKSLDAGAIVKKAANNAADLRTLLAIIGERDELKGIDKLSKDIQIYDALMTYAFNQPDAFLSLVNDWKKQISDAFEYAKSFKALDLTKDGFIALLIDQKTQIMFSGLKGKGDTMITGVMEDCLGSEIYKSCQTFIEAIQKLK